MRRFIVADDESRRSKTDQAAIKNRPKGECIMQCMNCCFRVDYPREFCPSCHARLSPAIPPAASVQRRTLTPDQKNTARGLAIVLVFVGIWIAGKYVKDLPATHELPPVSSITFPEFDSKFSEWSQTTDVQKQRLIEQYKGKRVRWEGIIENVNDDCVFIRHKATTLTDDVILRVMDSDKPKLASLNKGDLLTYEGTIEDFGTVLDHDLHDGQIVSTRTLSPDERTTWLMKSETEALKPIADEVNR